VVPRALEFPELPFQIRRFEIRGVELQSNGALTPIVGSAKETTNNQMELMAAIVTLEQFQDCEPTQLRIFSDSEYLVKGMTERIRGWEQRGWRKADGKPVENIGYWQSLKALAARHKIEWRWVRGHDGNEYNEMANKLAQEAAKKIAIAVQPRASASCRARAARATT
jgi:ribonuclease HI